MAARFMGFQIRVDDPNVSRIAVNYVYRSGCERLHFDVSNFGGTRYAYDNAQRDNVDYLVVSCCTGANRSKHAGTVDYYNYATPGDTRRLSARIARLCAWRDVDDNYKNAINNTTYTYQPCA